MSAQMSPHARRIDLDEVGGPELIAGNLLNAVSGGDGVPTVKPGSNRCSDFECKWENAKDFVAWVGRQWDDLWD